MLSVKIGHYHPSLEDSLVNVVRTLKKDDPLTPLAVVAPSNRMLNRLQERLVLEPGGSSDTTEDTGFINISFMNFFVLAREVCRRSGIDTGRVVQKPVVYEGVISGLLKHHTFREYLFSDVQSLPALARAMFQVIQDLTDANVQVDALKEAVREGFIEGAEIQKLYGIIHLFDMFRQKVNTMNVSHYTDVYRLAAACVSDSEYLGNFKSILAYGFYDLTGVEQDLFGEIFRSCPTILFLPYQKKHPAFSYVKPFFESFVFGLAQDIEEIPADNSTGYSYVLDPVSDTAGGVEIPDVSPLRPQHATGAGNTDVHIINASGKKDEVWTVAKEILTLAGKGYRFDEIGVVARTLDPYLETIKNIFHENCIPFLSSSQESIEKYPLVKVVQKALLLKRENYYRPMVIEVIGSPYFKMPACDLKAVTPRPDLWDILSRRLEIRDNIDCWLTRLAQSKTSLREMPDREAAGDRDALCDNAHEGKTGRVIPIPIDQIEFLENVLGRVSHDLLSLPEKASWTVMSQKITQILQNYIHIPLEYTNSADKRRDQLILDKMYELLRVLQILDNAHSGEVNKPVEEVTLDQFIDTFVDGCRQEGLPVGVENGRGVKVLDAMSARGIPFRVLFIVGLNEKVFPRAISEDPFLRDHVRRRFSEVLGNCIPEKLRGYEEERLLFYLLLNAARERLYFLFERSDEAGKPKVQSHYLMDFLQNMKGISVKGTGLREKSKQQIYVPRGIKDKLCQKEATLLTPGEIGIRMAFNKTDPTLFMKIFGISPDAFSRSQSALHCMEGYTPHLTAHDGIVGDMAPWCDKQWSRGISPTSLEVFGVCPFKYFMEKVLELESLEEPEKVDVMASEDIGSLYHSILKEFYGFLLENEYFSRKQKEINPLERLHEISQRHFAEIERQRPIPYPILWELMKEEMFTFLSDFITWDLGRIEQTGYVPAFLERSVKLHLRKDLPESAGKFFRQEDTSNIVLKGKVDRIDLHATENAVGFRVIDYKSGKYLKENIARSAIQGKRMQLPFYIAMAEHLISGEMKKGCIPGGEIRFEDASFVYVAQKMEEKKGRTEPQKKTIGRDDWAECVEQFGETIKEFIRIIREGLYPVSPSEDTQACEWCGFAAVCRRRHQPLRFRLEHDARLKKYREVVNSNTKKR